MIKHLRFTDLASGWTLQETRLEQFNLLVGLSGAGKSWTLRAIQAICQSAAGKPPQPSLQWELGAALGGAEIRWSAQTSPPSPGGNDIHYLHEQVSVDGTVILERRGKSMTLRGATLPALNSPQSAVALFADDPMLKMLHHLGYNLLHSRAHELVRQRILPMLPPWSGTLDALRVDQTLDEIQKIAILQADFQDVFREVVQSFQEVFPRVEQIRLREDKRVSGSQQAFFFEMRERGIPQPIPQHRISSGMMRTLRHLFELMLAAPGSVVLIDELENSLGYNCLGSVSESLIAARTDLQFVVTSHHPYILNQIPRERWKLVRRDGLDVRILPAQDIPELETRSRQDSFTLLLRYYDRMLQEQ